jgi:hypothetical protein
LPQERGWPDYLRWMGLMVPSIYLLCVFALRFGSPDPRAS